MVMRKQFTICHISLVDPNVNGLCFKKKRLQFVFHHKLDYYLHNAQFIIRTAHKSLKNLLKSPMQNKKIHL